MGVRGAYITIGEHTYRLKDVTKWLGRDVALPFGMPPRPPRVETFYVYLAYGEDGTLLYIGQTNSWPHRWTQHATDSGFYDQVRRLEIRPPFKTRREAEELEAQLIEELKPKHNGRPFLRRKRPA